jgi:uncharacterized protein (TIGR03382 family)
MARVPLADAPDGTAAAQVSWASSNAFSIDDVPDTVPTAPKGHTYQAGAWVRGASASAMGKTVQVVVREQTPGGLTYLDEWYAAAPLTGTFQRLTAYGTVNTAGDDFDVYVSEFDADAGDALYVDGITLVDLTGTRLGYFADDFEQGALLGPTSPWSTMRLVPGNTFAADPAAAHRGQFGARLVDAVTVGAARGEGVLETAQQRLNGDVYLRFWARASLTGTDTVYLCTIISERSLDWAELELRLPAQELMLAGYESDAGFHQLKSSVQPAVSEWHLYEIAVQSAGTRRAGRSLWVDGTLSAQETELDQSNGDIGAIDVGETWADVRAAQGTLDFDDVRISLAPPASRLAVDAAADAGASECLPVKLSLLDSSGKPAFAPYDVVVELSANPAAAFFIDSTCRGSTRSAIVSTDQPRTTAYVQPLQGGELTLTAQHPDFLAGSATLSVSPPRSLTAGCGCGSNTTQAALAAVMLVGWRRRRRRQ